MSEQSIELDCAPGCLRPGHLFYQVIDGLGLPERETCSRFFGNWKWDFSDVPADEWAKVKPILKERITTLYHKGAIRYGSW